MWRLSGSDEWWAIGWSRMLHDQIRFDIRTRNTTTTLEIFKSHTTEKLAKRFCGKKCCE
jgi:hypothetical protein